MTQSISPVELEIDLDESGWHQGFARVPHSVHRSAYGFIPLPVISIKNGDGPVILLMGGNHGDEYEGQVALNNLAQSLTPEQINGQLIILPMANFPAAQAGTRTSPLDQGNLNRSFPGNPAGTPTDVIAHFIEHTLLARADYLLDIHSGGSSLYYRPTAMLARSADPSIQKKRIALLKALGMPKSLLYNSDLRAGYSSSAAARQNAIGVTVEIGGGGRITPVYLQLLEKALLHYLQHLDVIPRNTGKDHSGQNTTRTFHMPSIDYYIHARHEGLFHPEADIDDVVESGQLAGWIHHPEDVTRPPEKLIFKKSATVISMRIPARVIAGDCLYETARETDEGH